jgi:hypothetical protein
MSSIPSGTKFSLFLPQQVESCLGRCCFVWHQFLRFSKETGRREARNRGQLRKTPVSEVQFKAALPSTRAARPAGATARRETSPSRPRELASLSRASRRTSNSWSRVSHGPVARGPLRQFAPRLRLGEKNPAARARRGGY